MSNQRFIATYAGTLDAKGRVCIPAPFRQVLAGQNTSGAFVCPALEGGSLNVFGQELMDAQLQRLDRYDPFLSRKHNALASQIVAETRPLPVDENGRVRLPDEFIKAANLKDNVLFVGLNQLFEIWNPDDYARVKAERQVEARTARENEDDQAPLQTGGAP